MSNHPFNMFLRMQAQNNSPGPQNRRGGSGHPSGNGRGKNQHRNNNNNGGGYGNRGNYGRGGRGKRFGGRGRGGHQQQQNRNQQRGGHGGYQQNSQGQAATGEQSYNESAQQQHATAGGNRSSSGNHGNNNNHNNKNSRSNVVMISKLPEVKTLDMLFNLFGVYGRIERIKIMFHKRDTALVQYQNAEMARRAVRSLGSLPFNGSELQVKLSKDGPVAMPSDHDAEAKYFTKDYADSGNNRGDIKNDHEIYTRAALPSATLKIGEFEESSEQDVRNLLSADFPCVNFQLVKDNSNGICSAFVTYKTVDQASRTLATLHTNEINGRKMFIEFVQSQL